jgi:DNA-binding transcriptional ArsR family regulator
MGAIKAYPRLVKLGMADETDLLYTSKAGIRLDDPRQLKQIVETIKEHSIKLVIVDTMTRVHRFDENDNSQMRLLYTKFSEMMAAGACVVVAHHERKGGQGESSVSHERARGASEISASADMCFSLEKRGGWHRLVSTKSRLVAEDDAIHADFVIEDSEDKTRVTLRPVDVEERSERYVSGLEESVLDYVAEHGPCNMVTIRKGVKGDETAKGMALATLVEEGKISKERDGKNVFYSISKKP